MRATSLRVARAPPPIPYNRQPPRHGPQSSRAALYGCRLRPQEIVFLFFFTIVAWRLVSARLSYSVVKKPSVWHTADPTFAGAFEEPALFDDMPPPPPPAKIAPANSDGAAAAAPTLKEEHHNHNRSASASKSVSSSKPHQKEEPGLVVKTIKAFKRLSKKRKRSPKPPRPPPRPPPPPRSPYETTPALHRQLRRAGSEVLPAAQWWLPYEEAKKGVGILFFAYGGTREVHWFLSEASAAALSIRTLNPTVKIAVCSNNATVDQSIFTHHIQPRSDLLFPGEQCGGGSCRPDKLPRQWTTRLYYMALSPFEITWAMDSNVYACPGIWAHNAIHSFLKAAERTSLWGYDIAHANQADGGVMFPHCFDLMWVWNPRTSNLFRDWLMLMLRRGLSADDQQPLRLAESRQYAASGLQVGQVPTEFAAAMYGAHVHNDATFWPRISRSLRGHARLVHATPLQKGSRFAPPESGSKYEGQNGPAFCAALNDEAVVGASRQLIQFKYKGKLTTITSIEDCRAVLNLTADVECPFATGGMRDVAAQGELLPAKLMDADLLIKRSPWTEE